MKKLSTIILIVWAMIFAVSCSSGLDADASRSGSDSPADLIRDPSSMSVIAAFINDNAGIYYSEGPYLHWEWGEGYTNKGLKVDYKFKNGQVYKFNHLNQTIELIVEPVEAVSPTEKKLQLRHKDKGEVLVFNMTDTGLESYVSYILEKVSDDVLIENDGVGGFEESLIPYKGTYKSIAQDNYIENYIAIDGAGNIYFHDANATISGGRVGITEGELTIIESYQNTMRKIIFKFDQGVYRRYSIDGENRDETYIGICEKTTDFIEDVFADAVFQTSDHKVSGHDTDWGWYPDSITGYVIRLNEPINQPGGHVTLEGASCIGGQFGDHLARYAQVGHVTVLKGNELHVMGRYNAVFAFSDDWKTATYNGQTLSLVSGEVKAPATARKSSSSKYGLTPLKRR